MGDIIVLNESDLLRLVANWLERFGGLPLTIRFDRLGERLPGDEVETLLLDST